MIVIHDQSSPISLAQSTALHGTLSQCRVTIECNLRQTSRNFYKPLLNGHPLVSGHLRRSQRCPLSKGFTIFEIQTWDILVSSRPPPPLPPPKRALPTLVRLLVNFKILNPEP